jgi:disintegrin and metalloproteinase domain-containing protein 10
LHVLYRYITVTFVCYTYFALGEAGSYVFGSISDGVFEGKIVSPQGSYYVEKALHYFPKDSNKTSHSVIYAESDIEDPYEHIRTGK